MPSTLDDLLALPADERAELAMALWASLKEDERNAALKIGAEDRTEIDRRWSAHLESPARAISWDVVRKRLRDRS